MTERSGDFALTNGKRPARNRRYSYWPGERGVNAWDVERLIALSADLPVEEVDIARVSAIDSGDWFNTSSDEPGLRGVVEHTRRFDDVDLGHPIILGADGRVMDGMRRVAKAILEGRSTIKAVRFRVEPDPDYRDCDPEELPE
jgi:hypothetical protein